MNILITGASRGIGYEVVRKFSQYTNSKIIAVARNSNALNDLKNKCRQINPKSEIIPCNSDLSDLESFHKPIINCMQKHNIESLDVLLNNAGLLISKPFTEFTLNEIHEIINVNFISASILTQKMIPYLKKGQKPHILNVGSMGGIQGSSKFPGLSFYGATKAAITSLTESLAAEFKKQKIYVNTLAFGAVQTEMLQQAFPGYKAPVQPDEMADFIYNFALNGHKVMNGQTLQLALSTP